MKDFKDCELKGLILNAIKNGDKVPKSIHSAIEYPKHIDALYSELHELQKRGYIKQERIKRVSHYSLTSRGLTHAANPYLYIIERKRRLNNRLLKALEATLRNEPKVKEWAMKFAQEIAQHPIQEHIHKSPDIIQNSDPKVEFINTNTEQQPQISDAQKRLDEITALLSSQTPLKKADQKRLRQEQQNLIQVRNAERTKAMREAQDKRIADAMAKSNKTNNGTLNTGCKECKDKEDTIDYLKKQIEELKNRPIPISIPAPARIPQSTVNPGYQTVIGVGKDGKVHQNSVRIPKPPTQDEIKRMNDRKRLVALYLNHNYRIDSQFFKEWGNLRPYRMKGFGFVKQFQRGAVEILSPNNQEIVLRNHTKGVLFDREIIDAQFKIISRVSDGIWMDGIGMKQKCFMKY